MGKCVSKSTDKQDPEPSKTPKPNTKSPNKQTPQSKIVHKITSRTQQASQIAKNLAKSGAKPLNVKSRPAIETQQLNISKAFSRSSTIRRHVVRKPTAEAVSATLSKIMPTPQAQKDLLAILKSHFLFNMVSEDVIKALIKEMTFLVLETNKVVYTQGNFGNVFYVVEKGKLEIQVNGISSSVLVPKQCFGELGLIQETPRNNTVITLEKCLLRCINRDKYKEIINKAYQIQDEEGLGFLESISLFKILSKGQLSHLFSVATEQRFNPGDKIINEGDTGDSIFIVKEGVVNCSKNGQFLRDFNKGDYFGEQGLLYQSKRNATCTAGSKLKLISISRFNMVNTLGQDLEGILSKNTIRIALTRNQYFKSLTSLQVDMVFGKMEIKNYEPNQLILPGNTLKSQQLLIILKGMIQIGTYKYRLYDILGDEEFSLENCKRVYKNDLIAECETTVAQISRVTFESIIGGNLKLITQKNSLVGILKKIPLFTSLPEGKLQALVSVLRLEDYPAESLIYNVGDKGDKFYIVKSGTIEIIKDGVSVKKIETGGFFGERSVITSENRTTAAVAVGHTTCWVLYKENCTNLLNEKTMEELKKRVEMQNNEMELNDLYFLKTLHKGIISKSCLVFWKNNRRLYFLRTISRNSIRLFSNYDRVVMEKNILKMTDHPFVGRLIKTFKDNLRLYFLMEYIPGQDLFEMLSGWNKMGNENAKFYAAGILIILEYLHRYNIIYRDLKPENVMIDEDGYPKISDFANSKIVEGRTYSIVGTPHYMAPEVIAGKGYNFSADYWSLGIMIYEFLFNSLPFAANEGDLYKVYQSILTMNVSYPPGNNLCKPLLDRLLMKNPNMRGNLKEIKENQFFYGVNWDEYTWKQVNPPRKPKVQDFEQEINLKLKEKNQIFLKLSVRNS